MERDEKIRQFLELSPFNPVVYESESSSKILVLIQRLSRIMKKLVWDKVKDYGLTATQGEILVHLLFNPKERRKVSIISEEFGISKPTVSRAINIIIDKGFLDKKVDEDERRSHILFLTPRGLDIAVKISAFGNVIADIIRNGFDEPERRKILISLLSIMRKLVDNGVTYEFPSCIFCKHFEDSGETFWCNKLQMIIMPETIRLNCEIFETRRQKKRRDTLNKERLKKQKNQKQK